MSFFFPPKATLTDLDFVACRLKERKKKKGKEKVHCIAIITYANYRKF